MNQPRTPLAWAQWACDTMIRRYAPEDLPPKGHFHYHQGVFLSGMLHVWQLCGDDRYFDYARRWVDSVFAPDGSIRQYTCGDLDDIQPGVLLFPILDKTGNPHYRDCLAAVAAELPAVPRPACGGLSHKVRCPGQLWLDGLYMAGPFLTEYAHRTGDDALRELAIEDVRLVRDHTRDPATGLWVHAWDENRKAAWCDPATGRAPEVWGRALGWVPVAIYDMVDALPPDHPARAELLDTARDLLDAARKVQGPDGRWYQVLGRPGAPGNWLENSCSCLLAAAIFRGVRRGWLAESFRPAAERAFAGVTASLTADGDDLQIGGVCIGTGVGDYAFYCARPTSVNDLHGVGAFLLAASEYEAAQRGARS